MQIERMKCEDALEVSQIEREIFSIPWSQQAFEDSLHMDNVCFLVAREDEQIAGYCGMYQSVDEGEITNVAVRSEMRGRKIGKALVEALLQEAREADLQTVVLEVRVSNASAIALYEKTGFKTVGTRKGFYDLPKEDAYIMIAELQ